MVLPPTSAANRTPQPALLLLGSQIETGGAQRVLLDQATWFTQNGWRVTAVFLYDKEGLYVRWQSQASFQLVNLNARAPGKGKMANLWALLGGLWRLWRLMRRERFTVVETFTHHSNLAGLPLAWLAGVPVRVASHHGHILGFSRWLERLHAWMINSRITTRLVAVSQRVRQEAIAEGVRRAKIEVIPNGVQLPAPDADVQGRLRHELGVAPGGNLILSAGRMTFQKAHTFLLQAAVKVLEHYPTTVFALAGDGPLRSDLREEAQRLGIDRQVRFLGIRRDLPQLMATADVFVLSSRWEGLPMVLLEAMGMGAPVVATRVEGVDEVVQDGVTGLLAPPENAPLLANAILKYLQQPEKRQMLGLAGQKLVREQYSLEKMCQAYARLFDLAVSPENG